MAAAQESLLKISYQSLQQFVEDINRNFAIIQNSPLYKGVPGDQGDQGNPGLGGKRGSRFFFLRLEKFLNAYPDVIFNGSQITFEWINSQLKDLDTAKKLRQTLGLSDTDSFVAGDVIVLTNSRMIEYDDVNANFFDTGISFYQQNSLVSSIETKIEEYVKYYVDNNPTILSLQNIFEFYPTFAKVYASTGNTVITNRNSGANIYMPYFAGAGDNQGLEIDNHKYFGFSAKVFPVENNGTLVIGSMQKYTSILNDTVSLIQANHYTSAFTPNKNNIPAMVVLQDTVNNGIMFGYKESGNIARFGSIFKDYSKESINGGYEQSNIHIRSDQGEKDKEDFSEILLNKYRLRYAKRVYFEDELDVDKDLHLGRNFDSEWIRTAEYIVSKYSNNLNPSVDKRTKTIEVGWVNRTAQNGYYSPNTWYRNLCDNIELPAFSASTEYVVLALSKDGNVRGSNGSLLKDAARFFVEERYITSATSNENLNGITGIFTSSNESNLKHHLISTWHLKQVIDKINAIQEYIKENYWRRDEWNETTENRGSYNVDGYYIPNLRIADNLKIGNNVRFGIFENEHSYFFSDTNNSTLTVGFEHDNEHSRLNLVSKNIFIEKYNLPINNMHATRHHLLTTDESGILTDEFNIWSYVRIGSEIISFSDYLKDTKITNPEKLLVTVNHLKYFVKEYITNNNTVTNETWHKKDFTRNANPTTGIDTDLVDNNLRAGNIPNIFVENILGGNELRLKESLTPRSNYVRLGIDESIINAESITLSTYSKRGVTTNVGTITLYGHVKVPKLARNRFVVTSDEKDPFLKATFSHFDSSGIINSDTGLNIIDWPNNLPDEDLTNQVLTAETLKWVNTRINNIIGTAGDDGSAGTGLLGNYWKKSEFAPTNPIIPSLKLKEDLLVRRNTTLGDYFSGNAATGHVIIGTNRISIDNPASNLTEIFSLFVRFSHFKKKVLVTDNLGYVRKDIVLCENTGITQDLDNEVPTGSRLEDLSELVTKENKQIPTNQEVVDADAGSHKTKYEHEVLTGKQFAWIQKFINNVKRRFINTFNRKETIDYVYDHMPVGSIIMWTLDSYKLARASLKNIGMESKIIEKFYDNIPKGWVVCDGREISININGVESKIKIPDLTNLFVRGVDKIIATGTDDNCGADSVQLMRRHMPNLNHTHRCVANTVNHNHNIILNPASGTFSGKCWSNKKLKNGDTDEKWTGANEFTLNYSDGYFLDNFEIPLVFKQVATTNWFTLVNKRHKQDEKGNNWRRYDFDVTRGEATIISSNLTTIFKNYCKNIICQMSDLNSSTNHNHSINDTNPGSSGDLINPGNVMPQTKVPTVPRYYKVLYLIKVDTRIIESTHHHPEYILQ